MNWLAHTYLGGSDPLHRIANLSGDFVRGLDLGTLDPVFRAGVRAHRSIDSFTDRHAAVRRSRARVRGPLARFAGPLVDVFYDHFLAGRWHAVTAAGTPPLRIFVDEVYDALETHAERVPPLLRLVTPRMVGGDWLASYATLEGVEDILRRMEGRLRRPVPLALGGELLRQEHDRLARDFDAFFPSLEAYVTRAVDPVDGPRTEPPAGYPGGGESIP